MQNTEISELARIMTDLWNWLKGHIEVVDTDAYWDDLIRTADEIWYRHDKHPLCRAYLEATMKYLESQMHEKREPK